MAETSRSFEHDDYTVGWICALPETELVVAGAMLDEEHPVLPAADPGDTNVYLLGKIGSHNVVIACLPAENTGTVSAAIVAKDMLRSFKAIRFGLMVGVGGGAPSCIESDSDTKEDCEDEDEDDDDDDEVEKRGDIRLGDVVISLHSKSSQAVVQYDFGKSLQGGEFFQTGTLNKPPNILLNAIGMLQGQYVRKGSNNLSEHLTRMVSTNPGLARKFEYQGSGKDRLFKQNAGHVNGKKTCKTCCGLADVNLVKRRQRGGTSPVLHYGTIGSADQVMKDSVLRDLWAEEKNIICFEMEAAGLMDTFPCVVIRGICDYADSHKNKIWQPYAAATAAAYAKELLRVIPGQSVMNLSPIELVTDNIVQQLKQWRRTDEEEECLQSFRTTNYETQKNLNPKREKETCLWCLEDTKFLDWRDKSTSRLLWVTADPGCGKSVLSRALVDEHLLEREANGTTVCYFFFKDTSGEQRSPASALSALLHQLFTSEQGAKLIKHAMPAFRENKTHLSKNLEVLWKIIQNIAMDPECGKIVFLIDALDECEYKSQQDLITKLKEFEKIQIANEISRNNFQFFMTSRPYWDIEFKFQELTNKIPGIRLEGEKHSDKIRPEIDRVIKARVEQMSRAKIIASIKARDLLLEGLSKVNNRTYLWLHLILESIKSEPRIDVKTVETLLSELPGTIQEAYESILKRSKKPGDAKRLLHIIVGATRPLSLREVGVALYITDETRNHEELEIQEDEQLTITIRNLCGLFVSIIDKKVFLIHQTAKEYLVLNSNISNSISGSWKHSLEPKISNLILTECWGDYGNALQAASYEGHEAVVKLLLEAKADVNAQGGYYGNALQAASYEGNEAVVKLLLEAKADVNAQGGYYGNALQAASYEGNEAVVKLLLEAKADVNVQGGDYGNALQVVSYEGNEVVVKLLFEAKADVNAQGGHYGNALQAASYEGNEAVVKLLLEAKADVNAQGGHYGNALQAASERGNDALVKLLLEVKADVNAQGGHYGNALQAASYYGRKVVVKLLLEAKADVNAQGGHYGNALQAASYYGREVVVKLLLEAKADVNAQGGHYGNALQAASYKGNEAVVKLLLEAKADVHTQGGYFGNALQAASYKGHEAVVKLLLDTDEVEIDSTDNDGQTSLSWAAENGHEAAITLLLNQGADINRVDRNGWSALQIAALNNRENIELLLVSHNATYPEDFYGLQKLFSEVELV
ncbi:putative ankyrin repeat-containing protein [Botrytis cinerea BcDW1]|uniref:Putative ankyrin repeat-containing protein n=1 Tax=Botryotinia fuckeliana (strain BcDW1) TaxID=1290391 RepID=M7U2B5_BOTF1|nr:putative ankyrin repeat-containing protein [Botrytis cinerea BcDW1]